MKLDHAVLCIFISAGLLSGCAYIEGKKADQAAAATETHPSQDQHKIKKRTVLSPGGSQSPLPSATPNPSSTASKMIAPLTQ